VPRGRLDVEAELGVIGGKDGVHAAGARTVPMRHRRLCRQPGWTRWQSPSEPHMR
jgi:hypothetical protein